ncbi:SCO family protein [Flavobacterium sp. RHBU_24]|uniref:SCO family protein n=1 Tax=Flavobacterium sp. RHBU_24 TaxID=3391185 RepID=UPI0039856B14
MKNRSYIGISFIILVFGIYTVYQLSNRCENGTIVVQDRLSAGEPAQKESGLYVVGKAPDFKLTNHEGMAVTQNFYKGKVYVVEFFFSTCPSICPVMNRNLIEIQEALANEKDFGIASITINPEFDTPEVLKEHRELLGITSPNWNFLTGDKEYIYSIANKGFKIYAGEGSPAAGGFEHSGLYALIDKQCNIRCRKDASGNPIMYYSGINYKSPEGLEEDLGGKYHPGVDAIKEDIIKLLDE